MPATRCQHVGGRPGAREGGGNRRRGRPRPSPKASTTSPRTRGPAPDRRAERGCWRPPGATVRGEGLKEEGGAGPWVSSWRPSPIQPTSHEPGHVSGPMRARRESTASRCTPSTPMPSTSSRRCVAAALSGALRPSAGAAGGHPQARRANPPARDPHRRRSGGPTGHPAGGRAAVRAAFPAVQLRLSPRAQCPGCGGVGARGDQRGDGWVAEFDIVGFFDHIRHRRLLREVAREVDDPEVIGSSPLAASGGAHRRGTRPQPVGHAQGGVISPLLANISSTASTSRCVAGSG